MGVERACRGRAHVSLVASVGRHAGERAGIWLLDERALRHRVAIGWAGRWAGIGQSGGHHTAKHRASGLTSSERGTEV